MCLWRIKTIETIPAFFVIVFDRGRFSEISVLHMLRIYRTLILILTGRNFHQQIIIIIIIIVIIIRRLLRISWTKHKTNERELE